LIATCCTDGHTRDEQRRTAMNVDVSLFQEIRDRLAAVESALQLLVAQRTVKDWYTTAEVAELLGKAEFTVREWCRLKRIHCEKRNSGRGPHNSWIVSRLEIERLQREGLLPLAAF
jgi:hypothetical protein